MLIVAGTSRGLTVEDMRKMEIGEFVDFCIEWNEWNMPDDKGEKNKKEETPVKRKATQADWDALFG